MEIVEKNKYMVCVSCMTYNHANFIEDTMNGFCLQQTNFPFVCIIVDDASTDGEPAIIQKYLDDFFDLEDKSFVRNEETNDYILTFARHRINKNCYFAVICLKYNHYSIRKSKWPYVSEWQEYTRYITVCEGDDYWVHPQKLQKQVDFLESDKKYGCVYSNFYILDGGKKEKATISGKVSFHQLLFQCEIANLTTCYRTSLYLDYQNQINPEEKEWLLGDLPMWLFFTMESQIAFLDSYTSVYRMLPESASHSRDLNRQIAFRDSVFDVRMFFLYHYKTRLSDFNELKEKVIDNHTREVLSIFISNEQYKSAFVYYLKNFFKLSLKADIIYFAVIVKKLLC